MAAAILFTRILSTSLTVPSAQLTSRPLAHAASSHTLRSVHHGIRMEEDGEDEAGCERVYQQNVESGATTTLPAERGASFVGGVVATANVSAAAALPQSGKEARAGALGMLPLEQQPDLGAISPDPGAVSSDLGDISTDLGVVTSEIREALAVLKAEREVKAAAAAAADADAAAADADAAAADADAADGDQDAATPSEQAGQHAEQPAEEEVEEEVEQGLRPPPPTALAPELTTSPPELTTSPPELTTSPPELTTSRPSAVGDIGAALAAAAADAVLRAVASVDRGISATPADAAAISSAIGALEEVAPCALRDAPLGEYLRGRWRLVYSSSLVTRVVTSVGSGPLGDVTVPGAWKRLVAGLLAAPAVRSRNVALGDIEQRVAGDDDGELHLEEKLALRWRVPWPLPAAPALQLRVTSSLQVRGAEVRALPSTLGATVEGQAEVPWAVGLDTVREALVGSGLGALQSEASTHTVTAASQTVHVTRSALGEVRVFARDVPFDPEAAAGGAATGGAAAGVAARRAAAIDPRALAEIARFRREVEVAAAAAEGEVAAAAAREVARARGQAAAAAAAAADEAAVATRAAAREAAVARRLREAEAAAVSKLAEAEAAAAAAAASAAAQLAESEERAAAEVARAAAAAEEELERTRRLEFEKRHAMSARHAETRMDLERRLQAAQAAAAQEFERTSARVEREATAARAAYLAEREELERNLVAARETAARCKRAARAAIDGI